MSLAEQVLQACRRKGWMLATAESCAGGMVISALTDIAGCSDVVERGFVAYSNKAKIEMLGVTNAMFEAHGAVSGPVVLAMAEGALHRSDAQIAVSITGIAGPGGSETKPEGLVWFGVAVEGRKPVSEAVEFGALGRKNVRQASVDHAMRLIISACDH